MHQHQWWLLASTVVIIVIGGGLMMAYLMPQSDPPSSVSLAEVTAWLPYWDQDAALASLEQNAARLDAVAYFGYFLQPDGSIQAYDDQLEPRMLQAKKKYPHLKIIATITNLHPGTGPERWDPYLADNLFTNSNLQDNHHAAITGLLEKNIDGIIYDFESLQPFQIRSYADFLAKTKLLIHGFDATIGALVTVSMTTYPEWERINSAVDRILLMTYEEHWAISGPGPIASLPWVRNAVRKALSEIPAEKLVVGLPLYGYDWGPAPPARGLTLREVEILAQQYQVIAHWNNAKASPSFRYDSADGPHEVWYENEASISAKLDYLLSAGVSRVFLWRLGQEGTAVWNALAQPLR